MRALRHILTRLALLLFLAVVPSFVAAQSGPDYEDWAQTAQRAEDAIEANRASDDALGTLRTELDRWRSQFEEARSTNAAAIATVRAQLSTLGPAPEEGATEAPDIATQRAQLNERLAQLEAPGRAAEVAWSRADALIRELDRILRDRQTDELLELGPSPLNPVNWPGAATSVIVGFERVVEEFTTNWSSAIKRSEARAKLPVIVVLLAASVILLSRGRRWTELLTERVQGRERRAERYLLGFLVSLGQIILPVAGMIAFVAAVFASDMAGPRATVILQVLPGAMISWSIARWVGSRMFPISDASPPPLLLSEQSRREGRWNTALLGLILAVYILIREFGNASEWSPATLNTVLFPLLVLTGLLLLRVARLLTLHAEALGEGESGQVFRKRIVMLLSRAISLLAIVGPLLAGIGYFNAGYSLLFPLVFTIQTLGILVILQRLATELYVLASRNREGAREALAPVLAGFTLMLLSIPVFALIWGARVTDLTEIWERFQGGFMVGETRISPAVFLTIAVVFALGLAMTRGLQGALRSTVLPKTKMDTGAQTAIVSGLGYIGIFLAGIIAVTSAGLDLTALGYVAGALSVGIGFGLQNVVSNFVSGIILLIERPVSEGDWIEVGGHMGFVRSISVRSTRIETFDRTDVIVPNADLISGSVTNWTRGNLVGRLILPVGVAYGTDTRKVEAILREIAEAQPVVLLNPPPFVLFKGFGASSLDFEVRMILRDILQIVALQNEMNHQIAERFAAEGIEIPFPQQDIWLRNPETLTGGGRQGVPGPRLEPVPAPRETTGAAHLTGDDLDPSSGGGEDR
ncbi:mechanosensitive ion channel protein MscS [Oceanicola sp. 22II-s10i]|uniref:DUF3772 domain-containing protein n=1 Tax=Oceanicola sp. 22II-s10i TaxID=1317116 RepID=UPI000B5261E0|nr:DUF3772 domain-containing protein [Oceanicola sp. 22II-s10i]OWU83468.1 mechanosensitive ion channel protein MscS [Oceanicola sp. 22II-s10i]